jgi:hypothetical protein
MKTLYIVSILWRETEAEMRTKEKSSLWHPFVESVGLWGSGQQALPCKPAPLDAEDSQFLLESALIDASGKCSL